LRRFEFKLNTKIILAVIYRHPSKEILTFQDKLCEILYDLNTQKLCYVIEEDININYLSKDNEKIIDYLNTLTALGCEMIIGNHTRFSENCKPSLLDHMYTNLIKKDTIVELLWMNYRTTYLLFLLLRTQNVL